MAASRRQHVNYIYLVDVDDPLPPNDKGTFATAAKVGFPPTPSV